MKLLSSLRSIFLVVVLVLGGLSAQAVNEGTAPVPLSELSPDEILQMDTTTFMSQYGKQLGSKNLTLEQKKAVRQVMLAELAVARQESKFGSDFGKAALFLGAGVIGLFIRRWIRERFF